MQDIQQKDSSVPYQASVMKYLLLSFLLMVVCSAKPAPIECNISKMMIEVDNVRCPLLDGSFTVMYPQTDFCGHRVVFKCFSGEVEACFTSLDITDDRKKCHRFMPGNCNTLVKNTGSGGNVSCRN